MHGGHSGLCFPTDLLLTCPFSLARDPLDSSIKSLRCPEISETRVTPVLSAAGTTHALKSRTHLLRRIRNVTCPNTSHIQSAHALPGGSQCTSSTHTRVFGNMVPAKAAAGLSLAWMLVCIRTACAAPIRSGDIMLVAGDHDNPPPVPLVQVCAYDVACNTQPLNVQFSCLQSCATEYRRRGSCAAGFGPSLSFRIHIDMPCRVGLRWAAELCLTLYRHLLSGSGCSVCCGSSSSDESALPVSLVSSGRGLRMCMMRCALLAAGGVNHRH